MLVEAAKGVVRVSDAGESPMLVVDGGVENFNGDVDKLIESGLLRRVLAMTEIEFSNLRARTAPVELDIDGTVS